MINFKTMTAIAVLVILTQTPYGLAVTSQQSGSGTGLSSSSSHILKVTGIVKKIENNILYLESGTSYNLTGVNVTYKEGKSLTPSNRKIAEMYFVNNYLKKVTIR